jgi:ABC-type multidrug transport system fused ATPase/permease subunit
MYDTNIAKRLWAYLRPYWKLEVVTFFVMAVIAVLTLTLPIAVQYMIDTLIPWLIKTSDNHLKLVRIVIFGSALLSVYLFNVIFSWVRDYLAARIGANIIADMRSQLFYHLERVSLKFHQTHQVGEMMSRQLSDVNRIQDLLTSTLLMFLTNVLMLIVILIYLLRVNWLLTLIALIPVPLTILLSNKFGKKLHHISRGLQETLAAFSARLQEAFVATRIIRAFGQERQEKDKVDKDLKKLTGFYIKSSVTSSLAHNFVHFINMIGPIVVLAWGTYLVAGGKIQLGQLMAFYILLSYLYSPIRDLAAINIEVQAAMASVYRIFEYLDVPPAIEEDPNPVELPKVAGAISLHDVTFSYGGSGFHLDKINLDIKPHEKIAIVGPSGSGKTTLINLIMRFFDVDSGAISIDGIDIKKLPVKTIRDNIGLVDQEPLLFKTSIFSNIAYADRDATLEKVEEAARIANIHDFICSQEKGYETDVGERGVTLSGGEKQRMCLARAILKNPPVIILDEATSSLDSNSEQLIQEALSRVLVDKTAIIIAHRLSTVQHADRIITLDGGRIVAEGTHHELLDKSPLYRELASKQLML